MKANKRVSVIIQSEFLHSTKWEIDFKAVSHWFLSRHLLILQKLLKIIPTELITNFVLLKLPAILRFACTRDWLTHKAIFFENNSRIFTTSVRKKWFKAFFLNKTTTYVIIVLRVIDSLSWDILSRQCVRNRLAQDRSVGRDFLRAGSSSSNRRFAKRRLSESRTVMSECRQTDCRVCRGTVVVVVVVG